MKGDIAHINDVPFLAQVRPRWGNAMPRSLLLFCCCWPCLQLGAVAWAWDQPQWSVVCGIRPATSALIQGQGHQQQGFRPPSPGTRRPARRPAPHTTTPAPAMPLLTESATPGEVASGRLGEDKLGRLAEAFARDGVVLLSNVIPHSVLDDAAKRLDADAAMIVRGAVPLSAGPCQFAGSFLFIVIIRGEGCVCRGGPP